MSECSHCGELKPISDFGKRNIERGYDYWCRDCKRDWLRDKKKIDPANYHKRTRDFITGEYPSEKEISIYALIRDDEVFYIGQSSVPVNRLRAHHSLLKESVNMAILKNVPFEEVIYWECKFIVEYTEAGCKLDNVVSSHRTKTRIKRGEIKV